MHSARGSSRQFTASLVNFEATEFFLPPQVLALEIAIGLLVPLAAGAWPVYRGVRVTVREAIASSGISDNFGRSRFDRLLQRHQGPSRPTLLSIRNTFRRKSRLALTLLALTLGGAVFMSVFTLRASLGGTVDETLAYFNYDVQVQLAEPTRTNVLVRTAEQVPGVVAAEPWTFASRPARSPGRTRRAATRSCSGCPTARRPSARSWRRDGSSSLATATRWSSRATSSTTSPT